MPTSINPKRPPPKTSTVVVTHVFVTFLSYMDWYVCEIMNGFLVFVISSSSFMFIYMLNSLMFDMSFVQPLNGLRRYLTHHCFLVSRKKWDAKGHSRLSRTFTVWMAHEFSWHLIYITQIIQNLVSQSWANRPDIIIILICYDLTSKNSIVNEFNLLSFLNSS